MMALQRSIDALRREMEAERVEGARFRRTMEDVLYNLEAENMPTVTNRILLGEKNLSLLVDDGKVRGGVLIEAINGESGVTINANRINLNGAVTANNNFKIHEDGSVSCAALTVTGGKISLPDPGDGSPVLQVHDTDTTGAVTVFADRVAFAGAFIPGWEQEAALSLEQLRFENSVEQGDGGIKQSEAYYRPGEVLLRVSIDGGEPIEARLTARTLCLPHVIANPRPRAEGMRALYMDADGNICTLTE